MIKNRITLFKNAPINTQNYMCGAYTYLDLSMLKKSLNMREKRCVSLGNRGRLKLNIHIEMHC